MARTAQHPPPSLPPKSFESALAELESLVQTMEAGKLDLEESLAAYQRGTELLKYCQSTLAAAEQRIRVLESDTLVEFPPAPQGN
jgi:exodeoxyribonuclease VII small subunit